MSRERAEILSLQYLRAFAALAVVVSHASQIVPTHGRNNLFGEMPIGAAGVDVFFVISGFIMCHITQKSTISAPDFFKRRLIRVAPSYWIITAVVALAILVVPSVFRSSVFDFGLLVKSLFFVAAENPSNGDFVPVLQIGWTLNYEFMFYALFAVSMAIRRDSSIAITSAALLVLSCLTVVSDKSSAISFYTNPIIFEFVFGMVLWVVFDKWLLNRAGFGILLVAAGLVGFFLADAHIPVARTSEIRVLAWGLPSLAIVAGLLMVERAGRLPRLEWLKHIGDASYALYLTHVLTLGLIRFVWARFEMKSFTPDLVLMAIAIGASVIGSLIYYRVVEKPSSELFGKLLKR